MLSETSMHTVIWTLCSAVVDFLCVTILFSLRNSSNGSIFAIASSKRQLFFQCYFHVNVVFALILFLPLSLSLVDPFVCSAKEDEVILWMMNELNPFSSNLVLVSLAPLAILLKCKQNTTLNGIFFLLWLNYALHTEKKRVREREKKCSFVVDETTSSNIYKGTVVRKKNITRPFANGHTDNTKIIQVLWVGNQPRNQPTQSICKETSLKTCILNLSVR